MAQVQTGERVYYTGDMANVACWAAVVSADKFDIVLKDEEDPKHVFHVLPAAIGDIYRFTCMPRFVTEAAYRTAVQDRMAGVPQMLKG